MRLADPKLLLAAVSIGFVLALFYHDLERTSPGPLSRTHAQDPALAGGNDCRACHGSGEQDLSHACTVCHAAIATQVAGERGFHGNLSAGIRNDCGRCHLEHHGPDFQLVGALGFREAGFATREDYDHEALGFALGGRHTELGCVDCHALADIELLERGQTRFIGLDEDCATCHEDPHRGRMARACDACHGQAHPFGDLAAFEHTRAFALVGAHARSGCNECHEPESEHAVEVLAGHGPLPDARACADCHEQPHRASFLSAVADLARERPGQARLDEGQDCQLCHAAEHGSFDRIDAMEPDLHAAAGFRLTPPHDVACARCHTPGDGQAGFGARFPGRKESDCAACHADPHAGRMGPSCVDCHTLPDPFEHSSGFAHSPTFALQGSHAGLACAACHDPGTPHSVEALAGAAPAPPARTCLDCHDSPHSASFQSGVAAILGASEPGSCAVCHDPSADTAFGTPSRRLDAQLHASAFPLDEPHAAVSCADCHGAAALPFALRYPGRGPEQCAACHTDIHEGQFLGRPSAARGCLACHEREQFMPPVFGISEHALSSFRLEASHRAVACAECHRLTDARTRVFAGTPAACEACHADAHQGAFQRPELPAAIDGDLGCARCHTPTLFSDYDAERFEHGTWTGFSLAGPHTSVSCERCHAPTREPNEVGRRFGFAPGRACATCHRDPHVGQFVESGTTDCARCHAPEVPFAQVTFDHDTQSRFPLDAQHRDLACSACHQPWPLPDGARAIRYKPLGTICADCHSTSGSTGGRR